METNLHSQRMKFYKETNVSKMEMLPFWQQNHMKWVWVSLWILCPITANLVQLWIFLYSDCHASAPIFFSFVFKGDCTTCFQCTSCRRINKTCSCRFKLAASFLFNEFINSFQWDCSSWMLSRFLWDWYWFPFRKHDGNRWCSYFNFLPRLLWNL